MILAGARLAEDSPDLLRAGAFAQDITPPKFPISVNGNMSDHQATAAHDPLYARCIVLKNSETSLVFVVCDSCAIPRMLMDKAKVLAAAQTGIPASNMLISATHAHSCPTVTPVLSKRSRSASTATSLWNKSLRGSNGRITNWNRPASDGVRWRSGLCCSIEGGTSWR